MLTDKALEARQILTRHLTKELQPADTHQPQSAHFFSYTHHIEQTRDEKGQIPASKALSCPLNVKSESDFSLIKEWFSFSFN